MASDREIERIRKDTDAWRALVGQLLRYDETVLEAKDLGFLESLAGRHWLEELSYRQAEWLLDIRDSVETVSNFRGFGIKSLLQRCYDNRLDFDDEDDRAWIDQLHQSGRTCIRKAEAYRLFRLAKRIGEIDDWAA